MALSVDELTVIQRHLCDFRCLQDVPDDALISVYYRYLNYVFDIFPVAILYYDYVLTLSREVEYFWPNPNRTRWVSFFFFLNRYFAIFGHIPIVIDLFPKKSCEPHNDPWQIHHYKGYFGIASQLLVAVLCSMRIYALYNKNKFILLALALAVASIIIGFIAIATESDDVETHLLLVSPICNLSLGLSDGGGHFLSLAWGVLLAFDSIIFFLTIYKAVKVGYNIPLIQVLVRDGSLYFIVLFAVNLANILTLQFAPTLLKNSATPLTNVLSATLISRLMLRLRSNRVQLGHRSRETVRTMDAHSHPSLTEPNFWFPTIMSTHSAAENLELESSSV